jgi:hypothetical protein
MARWCDKWSEEDGSEELETEGAREETMETNNWASQNSQGVVELKKKKSDVSARVLCYITKYVLCVCVCVRACEGSGQP